MKEKPCSIIILKEKSNYLVYSNIHFKTFWLTATSSSFVLHIKSWHMLSEKVASVERVSTMWVQLSTTEQDDRLLSSRNIKGMAQWVGDATLVLSGAVCCRQVRREPRRTDLPSSFRVLYVSYSAKGMFCFLISLLRLCDPKATCRKEAGITVQVLESSGKLLCLTLTHRGHTKYLFHEAIAL